MLSTMRNENPANHFAFLLFFFSKILLYSFVEAGGGAGGVGASAAVACYLYSEPPCSYLNWCLV